MLLPVTEWTRTMGVPMLAKWRQEREFLRPHPLLAYAPINQRGSGPYEPFSTVVSPIFPLSASARGELKIFARLRNISCSARQAHWSTP